MSDHPQLSTILVTGANGEIGQALIAALRQQAAHCRIIALDLKPPVHTIRDHITASIEADIAADRASYENLILDHDVDTIFHLAALLSTASERDPERAHRVNVNGTFAMLSMAARLGRRRQHPVAFVFPSSIAAYGLRDKPRGDRTPACEDQFLQPLTMYGINKLYCEQLGLYYSTHDLLSDSPPLPTVDFRCARLPGIIGAETLPTGGTSDYAPEMIHAAAQGKPYAAFVRPDTTIPFMVMPDAVRALLDLSKADRRNLSRSVYNVTSFSLSAGEIAHLTLQYFPTAAISFAPDPKRQRIVDSWPPAIDDTLARRDWGWQPQFDAHTAFESYLIPAVRRRYQPTASHE